MYYKKYRKQYGAKSGKKLSKKQKKQVQSIIKATVGPEIKDIVFEQGLTTVTNAGTAQNISTTIVPGTDSNQRIGTVIKLVDFRFNIEVLVSQQSILLSADTYNHIRIVFFRWYQAGTPLLANVLSTTGLVNNCFRQYNTHNIGAGILHIVYDKTWELYNMPVDRAGTIGYYQGPGCTNGVMNKVIPLSKLGKHHINFLDSTYSSELADGHLWYFILSDSQGSPNPTYMLSSTLRYVDA